MQAVARHEPLNKCLPLFTACLASVPRSLQHGPRRAPRGEKKNGVAWLDMGASMHGKMSAAEELIRGRSHLALSQGSPAALLLFLLLLLPIPSVHLIDPLT